MKFKKRKKGNKKRKNVYLSMLGHARKKKVQAPHRVVPELTRAKFNRRIRWITLLNKSFGVDAVFWHGFCLRRSANRLTQKPRQILYQLLSGDLLKIISDNIV